jgi:recombinational DNA repair protein RecR
VRMRVRNNMRHHSTCLQSQLRRCNMRCNTASRATFPVVCAHYHRSCTSTCVVTAWYPSLHL